MTSIAFRPHCNKKPSLSAVGFNRTYVGSTQGVSRFYPTGGPRSPTGASSSFLKAAVVRFSQLNGIVDQDNYMHTYKHIRLKLYLRYCLTSLYALHKLYGYLILEYLAMILNFVHHHTESRFCHFSICVIFHNHHFVDDCIINNR